MTWAEHHRRDLVLRTVVELADRRRDGLLPWDEIAEAEPAFATTADLLGALQMRWYTRLSGTVDSVLADQPDDLERAVVHAWRYAAADAPGVRAILDHPTIAAARGKELALLACASGLAETGGDRSVAVGQRVEDRARGITVETRVSGTV